MPRLEIPPYNQDVTPSVRDDLMWEPIDGPLPDWLDHPSALARAVRGRRTDALKALIALKSIDGAFPLNRAMTILDRYVPGFRTRPSAKGALKLVRDYLVERGLSLREFNDLMRDMVDAPEPVTDDAGSDNIVWALLHAYPDNEYTAVLDSVLGRQWMNWGPDKIVERLLSMYLNALFARRETYEVGLSALRTDIQIAGVRYGYEEMLMLLDNLDHVAKSARKTGDWGVLRDYARARGISLDDIRAVTRLPRDFMI